MFLKGFFIRGRKEWETVIRLVDKGERSDGKKI